MNLAHIKSLLVSKIEKIVKQIRKNKVPELMDVSDGDISERKNDRNIVIDDDRYGKAGFVVLLVMFMVVGLWAGFASVDSASMAEGVVQVDSKTQPIQHFEGGLVSRVLIKEGDRVEKGQALIHLNELQAKAQLDVFNVQYYDLIVTQSRLESEKRDAETLEMPSNLTMLTHKHPWLPAIVQDQVRMFEQRKELRQVEKEILEKKLEQLAQQEQGLSSVLESAELNLASYQQEVSEWRELFYQQLTDKKRLQEVERKALELSGQVNNLKADVSKIQIQKNETKLQLLQVDQRFVNDVVSELKKVRTELADLSSKLDAINDRLERTVIKAPVSGIVVGLEISTEGLVIQQGKTILSIVPEDQDFVIEAKLAVTDIDKVRIGQSADVLFPAYNMRFLPSMMGELVNVSADRFTDPETNFPYYKARIKLAEESLKIMEKEKVFLVSGMPAQVLIKAQPRTMLEYLLQPFNLMMMRAFRED